jgi:drug/metabolite transporter (DMT)-like permease
MSKVNREKITGGTIVSLIGIFIMGVSIFGEDASSNAPRWIISGVGGVFLLAGPMIVFQQNELVTSLIGALIVTSFAVITSWVSIGPGEREFGGSIGIFDLSGLLGRICFGIVALFLIVLAVFVWVDASIKLRKFIGGEGDPD